MHAKDFAQVFDVYADNKYELARFRRIATVIAAKSGHEDVAEFIRCLTFNTLIANGDMHLKNWSLTYPDDRHARLSPAYDLVSTVPYIPDDQSALNFSRTRKFSGYTEDELRHLSAKAALPHKLVQDAHRETVGRFMANWSAEKNHLPMGREVMDQSMRISRQCRSSEGTARQRPVRDAFPERPPNRGNSSLECQTLI